jgi:hypothetical protein
MTSRRLLLATMASSLAWVALGAEPSTIEALRGKFPQGIPWHVEFADASGKSLGAIDMRITSEPGHSCLGGMDGAVRVDFVRKANLSSTLFTTSYGVAKLAGNSIKIDLTGGMCDAYLLMNGEVTAEGASSGDLYTFGMRGGHDEGKYKASVTPN